MREAVALKRRISLRAAGLPEPIVAGFRSNGFFSVFFDQDPVYQFDDRGRLRRAFRRGLLYRTQGHTLAELTRVRTVRQTILERRDLNPTELSSFVSEMGSFLSSLQQTLANGQVQVLATVPADGDLTSDVAVAMDQVLAADEQLAPAFPTRRE